jgi:glycosyltransferase involved in cell wall biosynthesis
MSMKRIALFVPSLAGGGAEKVSVNLLKELVVRKVPVDLVLAAAEGPYLDLVPKQVRIVNLAAGRVVKAILPLTQYLRQNKPIALLSQMHYANIAAVLAKELSRSPTRLVLVEQNTASCEAAIRTKFIFPLMKLLYPRADAVVGVSKGVAKDLVQLGISGQNIHAVYSPIVDQDLIAKSQEPLEHPWFQAGTPPVFLNVGRLTDQKDQVTLIRAFALLRQQTMARLLILGEGKDRSKLEAIAQELGVADDISMPGFVKNPYAYMSRASAFVLSSLSEGLPTVLIEAMACGCPVISTDCPYGPEEILEGGVHGSLVPVGDAIALSTAMAQVLKTPLSKEALIQRAMEFSAERSVSQYLALFDYPGNI